MMNSNEMYESLVLTWEKQKNNLLVRFPELTRADLNFKQADKYKMYSLLQRKLGWTPNELEVIALA